jgi:RalA-binding protein 1
MAALIAAAGSPEAAMMALWRDKQSTQSHNAQLWRLVEKQRAMVIGLQRDLERALKDKDRYRRKAKEALDQIPPIPGMKRSDTLNSIMERDQSASPVPGDRSDAPPTPVEYRNTPPPEQTATSEQTSPPETHEPTVTQNQEQEQEQEQEQKDPQMYPESQLALSPTQSEGHSFSPTASGTASQAHSPGVFAVKPLDFSVKAPAANVALQENSLDAQLNTKLPAPETPTLNLSASGLASQQQPQLALTQPTPEMRGGAFSSPPRKPVHPLRKAPPAPLNLSKPMATSAHLHQATHGDSEDSDYDDTLEVEEIPVVVERGRRKTREEDDRVREAIVAKEEEARSKSAKKKSGSKGKASPANESDQTVPVPQSPRQLNLLQAGLPLSPRHPPAGSLNAILSPTGSDTSMMANRSVGSLGSPPLLSPGLPTSPRPGDRPPGSPLPRHPKQSIASPPMSPTTTLSPGARSLQQPVPLPPNTPQSYQSLPTSQAEKSISTKKSDLLAVPNAQPSPDSASSSPTLNDTPDAEHVYRGLVSDQYPGLLLPPNALPSIEVKVFSSRLRPSRLSFLAPRPHEEDPVFTLAVYARSDNRQLWRLEKTIATLPALDSQLKSLCDFQGKLPERVLFSGHAPAKIDARRAALTLYFDVMLETPMSEKAALIVCEFFSTDVIGAQMGDRLTPEPILAPTAVSVPKTRQNKEGYLTKRGKNFGGWKARYFVLDGPEFRYYEVEGGAHLGTIKLLNAQIGKQSQQQSNQSPQRRDDAEDNQYRHAFLILEPKRKDSASLVRHVLCAENDEERDVWVDALLQHVDWQDEKSPTDKTEKGSSVPQRLQKPHGGQNASRSQSRGSPDVETMDRLQGIKYNDTIAAEAPVRGPNHRDTIGNKSSRESPKGTSFSHDNSSHYPVISAPSNGTRIRDAETWGNKPMSAPTSALPAVPTSIKDKKRSIFGFRGRGGSSDLAPIQIANHPLAGFESRTLLANRNIFGMTLQEAVDFSQPIGYNAQLPSVVYRSLEYLKAKNAISEEGIFRLSGSNIVIKALRERFNTEGDIKLLDGPYTDVHAIASLLKLYLRELPASILTRELHLDFLKVLGKFSITLLRYSSNVY